MNSLQHEVTSYPVVFNNQYLTFVVGLKNLRVQ